VFNRLTSFRGRLAALVNKRGHNKWTQTQVSENTSVSGMLRIWGPAPLIYGAG